MILRPSILALTLSLAGAAWAAPPSAQIDALFAPWSGSDSPGCALSVSEQGLLLYEAAYGMADLEQGVANRPDTVFNIASLSKHFTTAAVALLAQDGLLSWDDDIRAHVPEVPDYGAPITLRHLAQHTSGLRDWPGLIELAGWNWVDEVTVERALDVISRQKRLNFPTGSRYMYSNTGYILLAIVVERVSGQSLGDYTLEHVFKPLGMLHTRFYDDRRMIMKNRAPGYYVLEEGRREDGRGFAAWRPTYEIVGDGAVLTSVQDLAIWVRNFLEPRLGRDPQAFVDELQRPGRLHDGTPAGADAEGEGYGLGLSTSRYRGLRTVGHSGGIPGYATDMLLFPDQGLAVTVLCNLGGAPASALTRAVADLYLDGRFTEGEPTPPPRPRGPYVRDPGSDADAVPVPLDPLDYAGVYYSDELDARYTLRVAGHGLEARVGNLPPAPFVAVAVDRFEGSGDGSAGVTLTFHRDADGRVTGYTLETDRLKGLRFERVDP